MSKCIIIFGGTSGIGKACVELLKKEYFIINASRSQSEIADVNVNIDLSVNNISSELGLMIDILDRRELELKAIIYSAGIAIGKHTIKDNTIGNIREVFNVNTINLINVVSAFIPELEKNKGHIIYVGSIAHKLNYVGGGDYCASKAASNTIMQTLRLELLGTGIKTTIINNGLTDSNFQLNRYQGDQEQCNKHYQNIKQLDPIDVAKAIRYALDQPDHVSIDEIVIKPLDQASHGITINDTKKLF